jgi:transcriptional regulator GlxA family with amidase domain
MSKPTRPSPLRIGGLLYPNFELLDLFGPLEMFALLGSDRATLTLLAQSPGPVPAAIGADGPLGPRVLAEHGFANAPDLDVLIVPGGFGTFTELENDALLSFLKARGEDTAVIASVCTGSALLARAGLLDGRRATTNKQLFSLVRAQSDAVQWIESARWVDEGSIVTASGVSAGTDMALALIARLLGAEVAEEVAVAAEYTWHRDPDVDPFTAHLDELTRRMGNPE